MSLLNRKPISIGRAQRILRDDRVFVVACDDTYAPKQYFKDLALPRVKVVVVPTPKNSGLSSPSHVVDRLKDAFQDLRKRNQVQSGDEFWVFLDTDHHFRDQNLQGTLEALRTAQKVGFDVVVSNPCFELWLLLHHADVRPGTVYSLCDEVVQELRQALGSYDKTSLKAGCFPLALIPNAILRARALEAAPDASGPWPEKAGTHVYRFFERFLPSPP